MAAIALPGALLLAVAPASGQRLVELRIDGPERVIERTTAQYRSFAKFDNGDEYEVTLLTDWSLDRDFYASIDRFGRLSANEVPGDVPILVLAEFTWDNVTRDAMHSVTLVDVPEDESVDPWPTAGRTTTRVGNTTTVGPRTPRIEWFIQAEFSGSDSLIRSSCSMDAYGRIFQGGIRGMAAVDTVDREVLWNVSGTSGVDSAPSVWDGRVYWGVTTAGDFFCSDAATGEELWRFNAPGGFDVSPCADGEGIVYYNDRRSDIYARRADDGAEVWTVPLPDSCLCPFALDPGVTILGGSSASDITALRPPGDDGPWGVDWIFPTRRELHGEPVLTPQVAYIGAVDAYLYAVRREDGSELWRFNCEEGNRGAIALGHDGTIYTGTSVDAGWLFAISPDGQEIWRRAMAGVVSEAPIVAGDGTIYLSSHMSVPRRGWVQAIRPNGTELWTKEMPDMMVASPMLAPDGTLYAMCRDKNLYAFRDVAGDLDHDGDIDVADLERLGDCMTGPRIWGTRALTPPGCELLDFNRDWDVDVADFARAQIELSAP
jgi:outer membrane protein assembly factor BamB